MTITTLQTCPSDEQLDMDDLLTEGFGKSSGAVNRCVSEDDRPEDALQARLLEEKVKGDKASSSVSAIFNQKDPNCKLDGFAKAEIDYWKIKR